MQRLKQRKKETESHVLNICIYKWISVTCRPVEFLFWCIPLFTLDSSLYFSLLFLFISTYWLVCILFSFILGSEHYSDQFQTVFDNLVLAVLRVFSVVLETIWYLLLQLYWTFIYWLLMLFIMSYKVARFHINYVSSCWYYLDQYLP